MRLSFLFFMLFLLGCILSIVLLDRFGSGRMQDGLMETVRPERNPLFPPPTRS
ncbi:hypothetical protein REJC140_02578 [Pseudorhizobium endolithicum]|uniref:Lipoprotein n=1 Tax=Pseudorhizobium endolithicum TaxID=1191678 RepID=A0ABN7JFA4_9HYPH|nr:hypothetical protein [Pseudorhizobium endolithicum]CAD6421769.1 hypothetical protein REQ54_02272 [Rhizobium sp. Q54]CAD7028054.1 hypothetical protein REJC140_02578 [Pseudorhizobium endolithicum]